MLAPGLKKASRKVPVERASRASSLKKAEISKLFIANLCGEKDWGDVYEVTKAGIAERAFSAATVESFLVEAIAQKDTRPTLRGMLVSERSWKRRRKGQTPLSAAEVERIVSVGKLVREARRLWPDRAVAEKFLTTPHPRLHGEAPMKAAATEGGLPAVMELLERIEEGAPV
jgi:putative toxin-antitoxin system antitoxin component (TIGR02293 family)